MRCPPQACEPAGPGRWGRGSLHAGAPRVPLVGSRRDTLFFRCAAPAVIPCQTLSTHCMLGHRVTAAAGRNVGGPRVPAHPSSTGSRPVYRSHPQRPATTAEWQVVGHATSLQNKALTLAARQASCCWQCRMAGGRYWGQWSGQDPRGLGCPLLEVVTAAHLHEDDGWDGAPAASGG